MHGDRKDAWSLQSRMDHTGELRFGVDETDLDTKDMNLQGHLRDPNQLKLEDL